ncbi:hypothetical protein NBG4_90013 [Candidatus Sulfobium mesophilum]|uniref:Uncharacterized protein n=1 Tax=Candidatus Sulfobium mesophilum TaxID=2016548 RepID=A0A2U3QKY3_9BACT|nr:hypothetical protein NBG4_90013 [Candidatus Sulfobium mesophilum]
MIICLLPEMFEGGNAHAFVAQKRREFAPKTLVSIFALKVY